MKIFFQVKIPGIALLLMSVSGCSVIDAYRSPQSRPDLESRSLPQIPEIKRQTVARSRYTQPKKVTRVNKAPVKRVLKPKIIRPTAKVMTKEDLKQQAKEKATVEIDPYATIPENKSVTVESNKPEMMESKSATISPAVRSLMVGARADIALGKNSAAVSKLERGLRIESQNSELWHLLSKANYSDRNYEQSINMAKKSIRYSNDESLIAQNWALIKKAGEKSGNATAIKEALDYIKLNP